MHLYFFLIFQSQSSFAGLENSETPDTIATVATEAILFGFVGSASRIMFLLL